ncbi:MAG: hypothetical protein WBP12_03380 [Candidatus Saccharimonas sp.]
MVKSRSVDTAPPIAPLSAITEEELRNVARNQTYHEQIRRERIMERRKFGHYAICVAAVPGVLMFAFQTDQEIVAPLTYGIDSAMYHDVGANNFRTDGTGTLTLTQPGLGIRNSKPNIADPLVPAFVDGIPNSKLLALQEGIVLYPPNTIQATREVILENNPGHLILYGMSTGGKEMLLVMAELRAEFPDLKMTFIADSSPFTADTAYELRADPGLTDTAEFLSDAVLAGGPMVNSLADVYLSPATREKYINGNGFDEAAYQAEWERILRDVWKNDGTPTMLRFGQVGLVASNEMESQLTAIASDDPELPPITFLYIANSEDHTVDVEAAIEGYRTICNALDIRFVVKYQQGLPHASENDYPEQYNQTITIALEEQAYFEYQYAKWLQELENSQKLKRAVGGMQPR